MGAQRMDAAARTAGALAHQIANYVGTLRTTLYLLHDEVGSEPQVRQDIETVTRTVDGAAAFVEALRRFAGAEPLGPGPTDLNAAVRQVEPELRGSLPPGATLTLGLAAKPLDVRADSARLRQLVLDLLASAIHTVSGGVSIALETGHTRRRARVGRSAFLAVGVSGQDLERERVARIFEPFVFDRTHDGGLLLPTVYATAMRSGGTVAVRSRRGRGVSIRVTLPLAVRPPVRGVHA